MSRLGAPLLLIDPEDYSAEILIEALRNKGFDTAVRVRGEAGLEAALTDIKPDVVIFNYHVQHPESLTTCATVKRLAKDVALVAVVSPGPALRFVREWTRSSRIIDAVIEKPLSDERFFLVLRDLATTKREARKQSDRLNRITNLVPKDALSAVDRTGSEKATIDQAAVVFTDIRRSSQLITAMDAQAYFALLNQSLSAQAKIIERYSGSVVKYTGDGVLATFRGMGSSYLALRCASELGKPAPQQPLAFGIGAAHGLILAGFVGDWNRSGRLLQYDVTGVTVHLAARLCSLAKDAQVITTLALHKASHLHHVPHRPVGKLAIRGFEAGVDCVSIDSQSVPTFTAASQP